ncbi:MULTISPECIES: amino acid aminotransferase [unclassified Undibacterium]|uniref:amino acid aminotransferase n=1 Tax=unclassified Undibacterium TaxID=2630295 RepID=UPI002AC9A0F8|nr:MULTISPECIES: amino acid aminotransferase [unclassified Undibacterium]MEB0139325.1 amino acid aminotransferase [Undibacterium sp. CCC2.1]MEB0172169.1 amino acid aminotransferase [Undibacterium sp. CCC1.1]MEB0176040.1 amino acid aminotransferase [Undibacterium sp. CCC3.4]MEB0215352.1 amino acid aminotransferase [Undibacterium sp. 5I2]WPX43427.1 amino acid aminotransferase [Undibacterium sp. CCC3.4]
MFEHVEAYAGDPILSLNEAFGKDTRPNKINLSIGIYFDDAGKIPMLPSVRAAEHQVVAAAGARPYLPMEGAANFRSAVQQLLFGVAHPAALAGRIVTIQTVGSSGGLKVGGDFIKRYFPDSTLLLSDPSWDNHRAVFEGCGLAVKTYPYYDAATGGVRFDAMLAALRQADKHSIVLLHACCHNPTGVDLSKEQWQQLLPVLRERELLPFLDLAYQGYGDGIEEDAYAIRLLADAGLSFFVANSFSKSMSLYGERCGALSVVCPDAAQAVNVLGQLKSTIRRNYSNPPLHGGQLVARVLSDPALRAMWEAEVVAMRDRIQAMRRQLHDVLSAKVPGRDFSYFLTQRGMFSYTGLSAEQCDRLKEEFAVYLVRSGRICVAGLNSGNVEAAAQAIAAVLN